MCACTGRKREAQEVQWPFNGYLPASSITNWYLSNQVFGLSFGAQGGWRCLQKLWTPGCFWHCSPSDLVALGVSRNIEFHMDVSMWTLCFFQTVFFPPSEASHHCAIEHRNTLRIYSILLYYILWDALSLKALSVVFAHIFGVPTKKWKVYSESRICENDRYY